MGKGRNASATPSAILRVRVTPRADRSAVTGVRDDGVLLVRVAAAPTDGAANAAATRVVGAALGVRSGALSVVAGQSAREKRLAVAGMTDGELEERLRHLAAALANGERSDE